MFNKLSVMIPTSYYASFFDGQKKRFGKYAKMRGLAKDVLPYTTKFALETVSLTTSALQSSRWMPQPSTPEQTY